jgi:hypothetical protein
VARRLRGPIADVDLGQQRVEPGRPTTRIARNHHTIYRPSKIKSRLRPSLRGKKTPFPTLAALPSRRAGKPAPSRHIQGVAVMAVITPVGRSPTSPSLHCRSVRKRFVAAYDVEFAADMQRNWMSSGVTIRLVFCRRQTGVRKALSRLLCGANCLQVTLGPQ